MIRIKRAYQSPADKDGFRILVDRLWPRGVAKNRLKMGMWLKDIAPSHELRRWLNNDPQLWDEFQKKYREELNDKDELLNRLLDLEKKKGTITLVYTAGDEKHNNAKVLLDILGELESLGTSTS
jgi:uncharacterized protein YeaO (DUF488 family)